MDWQLPDIGKMIMKFFLPSILRALWISIWRFHSLNIGTFRQCIDTVKSVSINFRIWSKYVG